MTITFQKVKSKFLPKRNLSSRSRCLASYQLVNSLYLNLNAFSITGQKLPNGQPHWHIRKLNFVVPSLLKLLRLNISGRNLMLALWLGICQVNSLQFDRFKIWSVTHKIQGQDCSLTCLGCQHHCKTIIQQHVGGYLTMDHTNFLMQCYQK